MGLDMQITKVYYIGANFTFRRVTGSVDIKQDGLDIPIPLDKIEEVRCLFKDWRKANHIHQWFVDNVQGGEDDCKEHAVSVEKLIELRGLCQKVIDERESNNANELLPTSPGFFFGSQEYDEYYYQDVQGTIDCLVGIEEYLESPDISFIYSSSW